MSNIYLIPKDILAQLKVLINLGKQKEAEELLWENRFKIGMIKNVGKSDERNIVKGNKTD